MPSGRVSEVLLDGRYMRVKYGFTDEEPRRRILTLIGHIMAGQVFVFFILTVAAAESAIGLAILVVLFRTRSTIAVDELDTLKG